MTAAGAVRTGRTLPSSRSWAPVLAWGAGLIQAAMGAGAIVGEESSPAARIVGGAIVTLGVAALVWGGVSLSRGRLVTPTTALATALTGVAAGGMLFLSSAGRTSIYALAISTAMLMTLGAVAAIVRRAHDDGSAPTRMLALFAAAAVIAVLVTPALGSVQDATLLRDDGTLPVVDEHAGH